MVGAPHEGRNAEVKSGSPSWTAPSRTLRTGTTQSYTGSRCSKLVDACAVSRGCRRADPDVRRAARMRIPARRDCTLGRIGAAQRDRSAPLMANGHQAG